jgi:CubicO group peptidase (beta-lactamase class C family)
VYVPASGTKKAVRNDQFGALGTRRPACFSGGGGLVSTAVDYHRFTQMLLRGGELDGVRLLGRRTVRHMASNHLPGNADLEAFGRPLFAEMLFNGFGFGLGFSVLQNPIAAKTSSVGEFAWGGAASTAFWVDPEEDITALFFTQLLPSSTHPIRQYLRQLVYQARVEQRGRRRRPGVRPGRR